MVMRFLLSKFSLTFSNLSDIFVALLLCCFFQSCQDQLSHPENTLHGELYVRYYSHNQKIQATLTLMEKVPFGPGTPKRLSKAIKLNDYNLRFRMDKFNYFLNDNLPLNTPLTLEFEDDSEKKHQFIINFETFSDFVVKDNKVSQSKGGYVTIVPFPERFDGLLHLFFSDQNNTLSYTTLVESSKNKLSISTRALSFLEKGPLKSYLVKKQEGSLRKSSCTINYKVEYYSGFKNIELSH